MAYGTATYPSGWDSDAQLYFTAASVTDLAEQRNLDLFFRRMKAANLWNSVIEGWTFRSAQSVGSGTNAPGLRRRFDGTLTNGPTWGANGITKAATNSYVTHAAISGFATVFFVGTGSFTTTFPFLSAEIVYGIQPNWALRKSGDGTVVIDSVISGSTRAAWHGQVQQNNMALYINSNLIGTDTSTNAYSASSRFFGSGSSSLNDCAFFAYFSSTVNASTLYTIYKETIGQGLSLP